MMRTRSVCVLTIIGVALLWAGAAYAAQPPETKCEAGKNQESGKYAFCLAKAEAKLLKTKGLCSITMTTKCYRDEECPPTETCSKDTTKYGLAVTKCEDKYEAKWDKLTQKAIKVGSSCPDGLLEADVKEVIDECVSNVAAGLAGEGLADYAGDPATCSGDLETCNGNLGTCNGNLATCATDLGTAQSDLGTCTSDLNDCQNPTCGNGMLDPGEECELAPIGTAGQTCGDFLPLTDSGVLACIPGSCTLDSSTCGRCGDAVRNGSEECDGSDLGGADCTTIGGGFVGGVLQCTPGNLDGTRDPSECVYNTDLCVTTTADKVAFATDAAFTPLVDFSSTASADALCQQAASNASLSGTFKAWLSAQVQFIGGIPQLPPKSFFPFESFSRTSGNYVRTDGVVIANGFADLIDGELLAALSRDEFGNSAADNLVFGAWTATTGGGLYKGPACNAMFEHDWESNFSGHSGLQGSLFSTTTWTDSTAISCDTPAHLYCFEQ